MVQRINSDGSEDNVRSSMETDRRTVYDSDGGKMIYTDPEEAKMRRFMQTGSDRGEQLFGMTPAETGKKIQSVIKGYEDRLNNVSQSKNRANTLKRQAAAAKGSALSTGESNQMDREAAFDVSSESRQNLGDNRKLFGNIAANQGSLEMGFGNIGVAGQTPVVAQQAGLSDSCCWIFLEARYGNGKMDSVVRRYRDEHMTVKNRRGYYKLSEVLVPLMRKSKIAKFLVQSTMTTPMFHYGRYVYGENKFGIIFKPIAKVWLSLYDYLGGEFEFIRENGEVV